MTKPTPKVGQIYRDTYGDNYAKNQRTIRLVQVFPTGVSAEVLTGMDGKMVALRRSTTMKLKTLRAGYELVEEPAP